AQPRRGQNRRLAHRPRPRGGRRRWPRDRGGHAGEGGGDRDRPHRRLPAQDASPECGRPARTRRASRPAKLEAAMTETLQPAPTIALRLEQWTKVSVGVVGLLYLLGFLVHT